MVGAEEEASEAEEDDGDARAHPAVVVVGGDEAEAEVDGVACFFRFCCWSGFSGIGFLCVLGCIALLDFRIFFLTCLHAHETAPDENAAAVQEACDDVASQQSNVRPRFADVCCEVRVQSSSQRGFGILLVGGLSEQRGTFCVDFIGGESVL